MNSPVRTKAPERFGSGAFVASPPVPPSEADQGGRQLGQCTDDTHDVSPLRTEESNDADGSRAHDAKTDDEKGYDEQRIERRHKVLRWMESPPAVPAGDVTPSPEPRGVGQDRSLRFWFRARGTRGLSAWWKGSLTWSETRKGPRADHQ